MMSHDRGDRELRDLLALSTVPEPASSMDQRVHSALRRLETARTPWWRREVRVPWPVLAALALLLVWALGRRSAPVVTPAAGQPGQPSVHHATIEARGYLPVTAPTVTIRRGDQR